MAKKQRLSLLVGVTTAAAAAAAATAAYALAARPWHLRWGAADDEVNMHLPGDELTPSPKINATHAVTIQAGAGSVWPWLVQMGQGRGGFYSYEWIDNWIGLDIHNIDWIEPRYQRLNVGDSISLAPNGIGLKVAVLEPNRALVLHGDSRIASAGEFIPVRPGEYMVATWGFYLFEQPNETVRLVERWRADWTDSLKNRVFYRAFLEPGAFLMERKMLLGIKGRVEAESPHRRGGILTSNPPAGEEGRPALPSNTGGEKPPLALPFDAARQTGRPSRYDSHGYTLIGEEESPDLDLYFD